MSSWTFENMETGKPVDAADFAYGDYIDLNLLRNAEYAFKHGKFNESVRLYQQALEKLRTYDGDRQFYFQYGKMIKDALDEVESAMKNHD